MEQIKLFNDIPVSVVNSINQIPDRIAALRKQVFCFDSSQADERYFRQRIVSYLNGKDEFTLTKTIWNACWEVNGKGKTSKYLYFNERAQRLYLDRLFWEWAKLMCQLLAEQLNSIDDKNNDNIQG